MKNYIDSPDLYLHNKPELKERTKSRLTEISELGMELVGVAEFGIKDVMSGLYIEKVWHYSDKDWKEYIDWVKELKNKIHNVLLP